MYRIKNTKLCNLTCLSMTIVDNLLLLLLPLKIATTILIILLLLCTISVSPHRQPLGLLLSTGGNGIFNVSDDLSACWAHEGETGTDTPAQVLRQKNWKMVHQKNWKMVLYPDPVSTRSRTHGSCFHWITCWAITELRPVSVCSHLRNILVAVDRNNTTLEIQRVCFFKITNLLPHLPQPQCFIQQTEELKIKTWNTGSKPTEV